MLRGASLSGRPFVAAFRRCLADGDLDRAVALAERGGPAWVARVARAGLGAVGEGIAVERAVDEPLADMRLELERVRGTRALARIASAAGLLAALIELLWLHVGGERGLEGLVAGLPERLATQSALLSATIGVVTALVIVVAGAALRRDAERAYAAALRIAEVLEGAAGERRLEASDMSGETADS